MCDGMDCLTLCHVAVGPLQLRSKCLWVARDNEGVPATLTKNWGRRKDC